MNFDYTNRSLHTRIKKQDERIEELISLIAVLQRRVGILEETFLAVPEDEILYEEVYKNPMKYPYDTDKTG